MKYLRWIVVPVFAMFVFAACGSDDKSSSSSTKSTSSTATKAPATTVEAPPTTPPAEIQVSEPLTKTPPAGKKIIFLQCELPACARYADGVKNATKALGWDSNI